MRPDASPKRAHFLAQVGICVQFLALVRSLAEVFRLRYVQGSALSVATVTPYVGGAMLAALMTWIAVVCYFAGRDRAAVGVVVLTIVALLVVKLALISP
jgi:hypothetical protein